VRVPSGSYWRVDRSSSQAGRVLASQATSRGRSRRKWDTAGRRAAPQLFAASLPAQAAVQFALFCAAVTLGSLIEGILGFSSAFLAAPAVLGPLVRS
jgi:hypothetical protein